MFGHLSVIFVIGSSASIGLKCSRACAYAASYGLEGFYSLVCFTCFAYAFCYSDFVFTLVDTIYDD